MKLIKNEKIILKQRSFVLSNQWKNIEIIVGKKTTHQRLNTKNLRKSYFWFFKQFFVQYKNIFSRKRLWNKICTCKWSNMLFKMQILFLLFQTQIFILNTSDFLVLNEKNFCGAQWAWIEKMPCRVHTLKFLCLRGNTVNNCWTKVWIFSVGGFRDISIFRFFLY